jgi:hypothetical protein
MVRDGIPERVAMQLSGHKTRAVSERYNIVNEGDLREAAAKMNKAAEKRRTDASRSSKTSGRGGCMS